MFGAMSIVLWGIVGNIIENLITDDRGRIVFSVRNISTANQVGVAIQGFNQSAGFSFTRWLFRAFTRLFGLNREYFSTMPEMEPESVDDRVRRLIMIRYGFDPDTGVVDPNGYIAANVRNNSQSQVVAQRINQAIASRMSLSDFRKQFRQDFNNPNSPLSLNYHYNRFSRDVFQEFDRTVQVEYANELGLLHAVYAGTAKNNTRCFCLRRLNRIYTDDFMSTWNSQNWQGKKPGVDVRIALGGFNCRHVLSWVTEGTAEALLKKREQKINTYNQTLC